MPGPGALKRTVDEAAAAFESLEASAKAVGTASMNSTLLAARSGDALGPLATLSVAVRECAIQCLSAVDGSKSSLNALCSQLAGGMDDHIDAGDRLATSVDAMRSAIGKGNSRLDRLNASRMGARNRTERILCLLSEATSSNKAMAAIADDLDAFAEAADMAPRPSTPSTISCSD